MNKPFVLCVALVSGVLGADVVSGASPSKSAPPAAAGAPAPAPAAPAAGGPVVGPPQVAWKDLTKEQKGKFMKAVVVPKMKEEFQAFDGEEFAKFDCKTCHGENPKANEFKMPTADLFVLPATPAEFQDLIAKKGKWMKFMGGTVKPKMAALLGLPEFNPKTPEAGGFGCTGCHTSTKDKK